MIKNKYMIMIGGVFLLLILLSREPLLARFMSTEEKLLIAIKHTINNNNYTYHGKIYSRPSNTNVLNHITDDNYQLQIKGSKKDELKNIEVAIGIYPSTEDIILCHYYEDKTNKYLITPFNAYEKLVFLKNDPIITSSDFMTDGIDLAQISVNQNIPIKGNQNNYNEVNVMTDCYQVNIDLLQLLKLGNQTKKGINSFVNEKEIKDILFKIYIDEGLYIRKIEGICKAMKTDLMIELYFDQYGRQESISIPDTSNATFIDEPLEEWILNKLK